MTAFIVLTKSMHPKDFGVAEFRDNKLINLIEKPENPPSNYVLTGIYFFTPLIFDYIKKLKPSWRNEYEITEAIQLLLKDNRNIGYDIIDGWWVFRLLYKIYKLIIMELGNTKIFRVHRLC